MAEVRMKIKKSRKIKCSGDPDCKDWSSVEVDERPFCGFHDPMAVRSRESSRKEMQRGREMQRLYEIVTNDAISDNHTALFGDLRAAMRAP